MAPYLTKIKDWIALKRRDRDMKLFTRLANDEKSGMRQIIEGASHRTAVQMLMAMLDAEGLIHCYYCPRRGTLRGHPISKGVMLCPQHFDMVKDQMAKKPLELVKP